MNTKTESPERKPKRGSPEQPEEEIYSLPEPSDGFGIEKLSDNIARLEIDLSAEAEARKEERFYWICACAFLADPLIYRVCDSFPPFLLIFMFQLVLLAGIAQKLGVDWAVQSIGWLLHWISERANIGK